MRDVFLGDDDGGGGAAAVVEVEAEDVVVTPDAWVAVTAYVGEYGGNHITLPPEVVGRLAYELSVGPSWNATMRCCVMLGQAQGPAEAMVAGALACGQAIHCRLPVALLPQYTRPNQGMVSYGSGLAGQAALIPGSLMFHSPGSVQPAMYVL